MRISTAGMQQAAINAILNQQSQLARTQLQVATGQRIVNPSDDPLGSQRMIELDAALGRIDAFQQNSDRVQSRLGIEENALSSATDLIQRVRELVVQASNDTQSVESRGLIATEIRQLSDALMQIANSQNGEGEYIFAGFQSSTQPFTVDGSGVTYNGDQGQRMLQVSDSQRLADGHSGTAVFQLVKTGNGTYSVAATAGNSGAAVIIAGGVVDPTAYDDGDYVIEFTSPDSFQVVDASSTVITSGSYVDGQNISFRGIQVSITGVAAAGDSFSVAPSRNQDMFTSLAAIATVLEMPGSDDAGRALARDGLNTGLINLDRALARLSQIRTEVGSRLNALDSQQQANDDLELQLQATLSDIRDLDFAEAIGRLNLQLTGLQAAQQAFARIQGLSLFNFL